MKAHIITIGDEILIGQVIDTNSAWMGQQLNLNGVQISRITTVHDDEMSIVQALKQGVEQADLVLITGGLGPTKDDITKKTLADYFNSPLEYHAESFENIQRLFEGYGRTADERYQQQAYMPTLATILINKMGTASGMWFEAEDGTIIVSMPGVPREMKYLMTEEVLPRLRKSQRIQAIVHRTLLTSGIGETDLSERLEDFETQLPAHIKLAYLPNTKKAQVRLRLTATGAASDVLENTLEELVKTLSDQLGQYVFGHESQRMEEVVGLLLKENKMTMATAESCTGGNIARRLTAIAGASSYFEGSVVAYANEVKTQLLGVDAQSIAQHGAVSKPVVEQMLRGACTRLRTDVGIATSGIAGPGGGSPEKPVGTVWIAVGRPNQIYTKKLQLGRQRDLNIERATTIALNLLRLYLKGELDFSKAD